jgi:hypothetical protein
MVDNKNIQIALRALREGQYDAGWRLDAVRAAEKLLRLAMEDRVAPQSENPRVVRHLHELVTPEWLWGDRGW